MSTMIFTSKVMVMKMEEQRRMKLLCVSMISSNHPRDLHLSEIFLCTVPLVTSFKNINQKMVYTKVFSVILDSYVATMIVYAENFKRQLQMISASGLL